MASLISSHHASQGRATEGPLLQGVKIACICSVPFFLLSQLRYQVEYLDKIGMQVVLVSASGRELSALTKNLRHAAIDFARSINIWKDLIALWRLFLFLRREGFTITHSITPKAGFITAIAAFAARVPVRLHTFTGQPWVTLEGPTRWIVRTSDRIIGWLNTRCFADSASQVQFLVDERIIARDKIAVIGAGSLAGVDLTRFNTRRFSDADKQRWRTGLKVSSSSKILLFLGRISRDKGIGELHTAFKELISLGYDADLLLVGPTDEECGGEQSVFLPEQEPGHIHYVGYTETPERYLALADILCLPSYREGFGTVVIEAAAMGVPTVGTRINGLIDAVIDGETGILVEPRDSRALFSALKRLLDQPELITSMGNAARQRCIQAFDAEIVNRNLTQEYMGLLSRYH